MARVAVFEERVVNQARDIVANTRDADELRKGLCVVLAAVGGLSGGATAEVLGLGVATVGRHQRDLRTRGDTPAESRPHWGGRRRESLPLAEEVRFLKPWAQEAERGGVLVVPPIHKAFEDRVRHPVAATTVYRMLARHGWRKVQPEPHHPNRDPEAQEAYKKTGRSCWRRAVR
jgi:transposase